MPREVHDMYGNHYRVLVGSLQYVTLATRLDVNFAVSKLTQFFTNPGQVHLEAALRILRYLKGTKRWSFNLGGAVADLAGFTDSDSDWGGDRDDRKSISAYIFRIGDGTAP